MYNKLTPYFILILVLVSSCISRPDYVLDEDAMVSLLTDVHRSEGLLELQQENSAYSSNEEYKQAVMAAVLVKHNVTRAQYDSSLVWYGQNLNNLVKVYNKVQKNMLSDIEYWTNLDAESRTEFAVSQSGDSIELWNVDNYHVFDENKLGSFRFWEIPSDSNYVAGDSIIWHINVPHVPVSHYLVATLSFCYEDILELDYNKTVVVKNDTSFDISMRSDTTRLFKSVIASISMIKDSTNATNGYAFVDSLSLIRIHK